LTTTETEKRFGQRTERRSILVAHPPAEQTSFMMAFDRIPPLPRLDEATVEALRRALAQSIARGRHPDELRDVLCRAADEARGKGLQAEQLLILLKEIWHSLPEISSAPSVGKGQELLQELISRCIQEYYSI
jgi:hypothetical protein